MTRRILSPAHRLQNQTNQDKNRQNHTTLGPNQVISVTETNHSGVTTITAVPDVSNGQGTAQQNLQQVPNQDFYHNGIAPNTEPALNLSPANNGQQQNNNQAQPNPAPNQGSTDNNDNK